jgi:hypothetical protein
MKPKKNAGTYKRSPLLMIKKLGDDVLYHQLPVMHNKRMARRRPSQTGAELGVGGPLDGVV